MSSIKAVRIKNRSVNADYVSGQTFEDFQKEATAQGWYAEYDEQQGDLIKETYEASCKACKVEPRYGKPAAPRAGDKKE